MSNRYKAAAPHHRPRDLSMRCPHCGRVVPILVRGAALPDGGGSFEGCLDCQRAHDAAPIRVSVGSSSREGSARP